MNKTEKEQVVAELVERLRTSDTLIVADYRGLTMPQIDALRGELLKHGARFTVVKNTLTRRAAEVAGTERKQEARCSGDGDDERGRIAAALQQCAGNQTQAAKVLGISRRTLVSRLEQYDWPRPRKL